MVNGPVLSISALKTYFFTQKGIIKAVDGVDLRVFPNETLGIVGESGCGKSMMAYSVLRLIRTPPGKIMEGRVLFSDQDLLRLPEPEMRKIRGNRISMIFQEPMTSLNPVITIGKQLSETIRIHQNVGRNEAAERSVEMLDRVQIALPRKRMSNYPYEMSGGMLQRVMIAMALSCKPQVLIADEPTTALDVTIQAQILDLIRNLKTELGTAVILITHNMGIVSEETQRMVVMYLGKALEEATTGELFGNPLHPYTEGLLGSVPHLGSRLKRGKVRLKEIPGTVPIALNIPPGCRFYERCSHRKDHCKEQEPDLREVQPGHRVRCWKYEQ